MNGQWNIQIYNIKKCVVGLKGLPINNITDDRFNIHTYYEIKNLPSLPYTFNGIAQLINE